jgi:holo-[acyl-carrier protein] synthase
MTAPPTFRVGIDLVQVSRIADSLDRFGDRFLHRVFTKAEIEYARAAPAQTAERLAARFAAKEATVKALRLGDQPVSWREIEVCRTRSGACEMTLHGSFGRLAVARGAGTLAVSLSHEGDYATAVVVAVGGNSGDYD